MIASAEALIRWNHPEKGMISPGIFIPALEESGQISELSFYVVEQVKELIRARLLHRKQTVPVSINLSWMDFYDETMINGIIEQLQTGEIPRGMIRFEVTETSYAALEENRLGVLNAIRKEGAKILLDDFGSGYSSFGMLRDYNFDILKIDMSFVRKIETNTKTRSILRFLIDMAHEMGVSLVAEGAETQAQTAFLRENGCDYIQGYYYSKPVPETKFCSLLDNGAPLPEIDGWNQA
ncbi:MAG: EAL domain-containing protein [Lachnospiraceae bacterium]